MTRSFEALIKDKGILAAEVMHEYDEKVRACSEEVNYRRG
jgi:hypothetical protein